MRQILNFPCLCPILCNVRGLYIWRVTRAPRSSWMLFQWISFLCFPISLLPLNWWDWCPWERRGEWNLGELVEFYFLPCCHLHSSPFSLICIYVLKIFSSWPGVDRVNNLTQRFSTHFSVVFALCFSLNLLTHTVHCLTPPSVPYSCRSLAPGLQSLYQ